MGVAHAVVGDGLAVVFRQQVAPGSIAVGIGDGIRSGTHGSGGVGIFLPGFDVAAVVVIPAGGLTRSLVILPGQLIGGIIGIGGGVGAVADGADVAVVIIGIGVGNIIIAVRGAAVLGHLAGSFAGTGRRVGQGFRQDVSVVTGGMLRVLLGNSAEGIVGIVSLGILLLDSGDPVIAVVGKIGVADIIIDLLTDLGNIAVSIVGIGEDGLVIAALLPVHSRPVDQIIQIMLADTCLRVHNGEVQFASMRN